MGEEGKDNRGYAEGHSLPSPYDPEPVAEEDLWFLPAPDVEEVQTAMPWPVAAREASLEAEVWLKAEASGYRALLDATEAVARFGERLRGFPEDVTERFALSSVAALLRGEGVWLNSEQIALYRALRMASDDTAQDLARASWAVRRLMAGTGSAPADLRAFLGREAVAEPQALPGSDRVAGAELDALAQIWAEALEMMHPAHPLTRAAHGFALWRALAIAPWDEMLEPAVAAMRLGAGTAAPFLPMTEGHRLDRHGLAEGAGGAEARLATFCAAAEAGALRGCMELDRLAEWRRRAMAATEDLSGRTPPALIASFLRYPVLSAELAAETTGSSRPAARRNLNLFAERGLIRELTGQNRYRFWTVMG